MKNNTLCKEGIIREITDTEFVVETVLSSACSGCHAKTLCSIDSKSALMHIPKRTEDSTFAVGDNVLIQIAATSGAKAVVLGYLLPLIILLLFFFMLYAITHNDLISVCSALIGIAVYYIILHKQNKKIAKKILFYLSPNTRTKISSTCLK